MYINKSCPILYRSQTQPYIEYVLIYGQHQVEPFDRMQRRVKGTLKHLETLWVCIETSSYWMISATASFYAQRNCGIPECSSVGHGSIEYEYLRKALLSPP